MECPICDSTNTRKDSKRKTIIGMKKKDGTAKTLRNDSQKTPC